MPQTPKFIILIQVVMMLTYAMPKMLLAQSDSQSYKDSIEQVGKQIKQVTQRLNNTKALLKSERDKLLEAERKILATQNELDQLGLNLARNQHELEALILQKKALVKKQESSREALKQLMISRYKNGKPDRLTALLNQKNPYAVGRFSNYQRYISSALTQRYESLNESATLLNELSSATELIVEGLEDEKNKVEKLKQNQTLNKESRRKTIASLDKKLVENTQKLATLKQDRERLANLVAELKKQAQRLAKIEKEKESERKRLAAEQAARNAKPAQEAKPAPQNRPIRALVKGGFKKQKGRLQYPVNTKPTRKFGSRLPESGMLSEGNFYTTNGSQSVKSIYRGQVLFSDLLKGYGLLIIIDHGDDHISLYGHNDKLLKKVGDQVDTNEVVAMSGLTGGLKSHGLYFEIRNNALPVDPAKWCL